MGTKSLGSRTDNLEAGRGWGWHSRPNIDEGRSYSLLQAENLHLSESRLLLNSPATLHVVKLQMEG